MMEAESVTNQPGAPSGAGVPEGTNPAGVGTTDQGLAGQSDLSEGLENVDIDDELEDFEHEGKKRKVSKALKPLLMLNQDYTRKTQEHSEQVRRDQTTLLQQQQQLSARAQAQRQLVGEYAKVAQLDGALAEYEGINWPAAMARDAQAAQTAWMAQQQLEKQRSAAVARLQQLEDQKTAEIHTSVQRRMEEAGRKVASEISGWSPELQRKLTDTARSTYGFSDTELAQVYDARVVRLLHDAHQYQLLQRSAAAAAKQQPAPGAAQPAAAQTSAQPVPAAALPSGGAGSAVRSMDDPRLSTDEWMRRRNQQVSKRRS